MPQTPSSSSTWSRLRLVTPRENADACAQLMLDAGCEGVQVDDLSVLFDESEDATLVPTADATITGYAASEEAAERAGELLFEALQRGGIEASLSAEPVPDEEWSTSWQSNFPPIQIGPFRIVPPWDDQDSDALTIRIDPGLAFGTGQHPTTRMCLELLAETWPQIARENPTPRVLDVGCGSGILSIAVAKLGGENVRVTGSDPDAFCADATRDNAQANGVQVEIVQAAGADWITEPFDLVVANLMSALLIGLAADLARATRPDGILIVSGISAPRADEVEAALHGAGFATLSKREQDGDHRGDFVERWTAFVMQRGG